MSGWLSFCTHVMLILLLINVHYLKNVFFIFEKGSNGQNHSFSVSQHQINNFATKFIILLLGELPPYPLVLFGKH